MLLKRSQEHQGYGLKLLLLLVGLINAGKYVLFLAFPVGERLKFCQ